MAKYTGLPDALRTELFERDNRRCRWCGATNRGLDAHHIEYRRGSSYDVLENLISLCRLHHGFVHGVKAANGSSITKAVAQLILKELVNSPGATGMARWRATKRQWVLAGRCEKHGVQKDTCLDCEYENRRLV